MDKSSSPLVHRTLSQTVVQRPLIHRRFWNMHWVKFGNATTFDVETILRYSFSHSFSMSFPFSRLLSIFSFSRHFLGSCYPASLNLCQPALQPWMCYVVRGETWRVFVSSIICLSTPFPQSWCIMSNQLHLVGYFSMKPKQIVIPLKYQSNPIFIRSTFIRPSYMKRVEIERP